jgi:uncharacterized protein YjiS (DUF1127 family)
MAHHERDRHTLEALADRRCTVRELNEFLDQGLPDVAVYASDVQQALYRLLNAREVDRRKEQVGGRRIYRYFRRADLDGPIADLARRFKES